MFLINMHTAPLAVLPLKPNFREIFCKWQTLTSYLIWTMIESMERLTLNKSLLAGFQCLSLVQMPYKRS